MHGIGVGNDLGALIFFSFVFVGVVIGLYLAFIKRDERPSGDKH